MNKETLKRIFEVLVFAFGVALGITILSFGFTMLYEAAKIIFK